MMACSFSGACGFAGAAFAVSTMPLMCLLLTSHDSKQYWMNISLFYCMVVPVFCCMDAFSCCLSHSHDFKSLLGSQV
jgi:hypothetical protein